MIWKPNVTVAAVIYNDGQYLMVEEETEDGIRFNQPAGHLECEESLLEAVVRETLEETAYHFKPTALLGVYHFRRAEKDITYLRFAFNGDIMGFDAERILDDGIIAAHWMTLDAVRDCVDQHRSPLILRCIEDHAAGKHFPLDVLNHYG